MSDNQARRDIIENINRINPIYDRTGIQGFTIGTIADLKLLSARLSAYREALEEARDRFKFLKENASGEFCGGSCADHAQDFCNCPELIAFANVEISKIESALTEGK